MISYAANGRISGVWIVRRLLSQKLIFPKEEDISYENGRHSLKGLQFSPEIRGDHEIMSDFRRIAHNVLYLYYFVEEQSYLKAPPSRMGEPLKTKLKGENLTGITLLGMLTEGTLRIFFDDDETVLYADRDFLYSLSGSQEILRDFVRTIYMYAGESGPDRILIREKAEVSTEQLSDDLFISYGQEEPGDSFYGLKEEEQVLTHGELKLDKNVASTLSALQKMMQDIDEASRDARDDSAKYDLSFTEDRRIDCRDCSVSVPDGFRFVQKDDEDFVMWLPNPGNPEEWEASLFTVRLQKKTGAGGDANSPVLLNGVLFLEKTVSEASVLSLRIAGVDKNSEEAAKNAAAELLSKVILR